MKKTLWKAAKGAARAATTFALGTCVVGSTVTMPAVEAYASDHVVPHRSILGDAVHYGILTRTFTLDEGDAETNVAAIEGTCRTQTGNDLTNPAEQPFVLARVPHEFRIKGFDAYVQTNSDDAHKLVALEDVQLTIDTSHTAEELALAVEDMLSHVELQSEQLASNMPTATIAYDAPSQKYVLDVRDAGARTHYVDVDDATYDAISREASKLRIYKNDDQTIVFNVFGDATQMHKYDINDRGADSFLGADAGNVPQSIVWNFVQATRLDIAGSVAGVVLAPWADVTVSNTSSGWLVSNSVNIGSGEWHNVNQEVVERPQIPGLPVGPESVPNEPETDAPETDEPEVDAPETDEPEADDEQGLGPETDQAPSAPEADAQPGTSPKPEGEAEPETNAKPVVDAEPEPDSAKPDFELQSAEATTIEPQASHKTGLASVKLPHTADPKSLVGALTATGVGILTLAIAKRIISG